MDDGSTDDLDAALAPYEGKVDAPPQDQRWRRSAFNAGVRAASGDFVAMLDADDAYERERIEALAELGACDVPISISWPRTLYLEIDGASERAVLRDRRRSQSTISEPASSTAASFCAPAIRRERLLAIGGQDEALRIGYDWDCYLRLILGGSKAGLVDVPLYRYQPRARKPRPATARQQCARGSRC